MNVEMVPSKVRADELVVGDLLVIDGVRLGRVIEVRREWAPGRTEVGYRLSRISSSPTDFAVHEDPPALGLYPSDAFVRVVRLEVTL